jgi:adenylate cyclase class 2
MVEVEQKFRRVDFVALEQRLRAIGAVESERRAEADHYFNAPDRDFAQTDEALRIRRVGTANFVTYKGPKRDLQTKTRTEIELPLGDGNNAAEEFARLLVHLGYRPVAVVRKDRRTFHLSRDGFELAVTLDAVDGVGTFAELEIGVAEKELEVARGTLLRAAAELGLTDSERRSYLELLLSKQAK